MLHWIVSQCTGLSAGPASDDSGKDRRGGTVAIAGKLE